MPQSPGLHSSCPADRPGHLPTDQSTERFVTSVFTALPSAHRGAPISYLVMPTVQRVARAYFACPELPGAELENDGGAG
jgi:hypothetical protein